MVDEVTKNSRKVLIAEDDPGARKLLNRFLSQDGYSLFEAENGTRALELFGKVSPDVVLTDLNMPGVDGLELLKKIHTVSPETPVIILSGVGTMTDVIEALRYGAYDYLKKPFDNQEVIVHTVKKAFELIRLGDFSRRYQVMLEKAVAEKTGILQEQLQARIAAEEENRRAQRDWERTFNAIPDLITLLDADHRIIRSNKAMMDFVGVGAEDLLGKKCSACVHDLELPPAYCPHSKLLKDGKNHTVEVYDERLGGFSEISVVPYFEDDGKTLIGSVHIVRDINERKEMEQESEKMQVKLLQAQKLESVGRLASGIAHEINTPIQFVSTNNEFLKESFQDLASLITAFEELYSSLEQGKDTQEVFEKVKRTRVEADWEYLSEEIPTALEQNDNGVQRVASIVRAMKEFSHPGSKDKELKDINHILKTTEIVARNEWKYVAELETDLEQDLPKVMCFADEIGQVFLNLIINAAHAIEEKLGRTPEDGKGKIIITTRKHEDTIEISIHDTGVGIPKDYVNKVFDPFFTTKKVGQGTGQGLAIAWNVVTEKHGGVLSVHSEPGEGSTFNIQLPIS